MDQNEHFDRPVDESLPTPNVALLRKAVDWAKCQSAVPVEKSEWYQADYYVTGGRIGRECTSAFCVAGFVVNQKLSYEEMVRIGPSEVDIRATHALGLTPEESCALFDGDNDISRVTEVAEEIAKRAGETL